MRITMIGQQDFGKAVLDALLARGDEVAAVFCQPEKPGTKADALRVAAQERGLPVHQFASLRSPEAIATMRSSNADIGLMAYVLQFVPQEFVNAPRLGTIQFHPSLLPRYRGPSSINWPIARGDLKTGLTIFRPSDGLDEGEVILQKETLIGPDDTLGSVYFDRLFPLGVQAMLEAADLVFAGRQTQTVQDESQASYEGWFRTDEAKLNFAQHVDGLYNIIRAANPAPGAWTTVAGKKLFLFDSRKHLARRFGEISGKIGEITHIGETSLRINAQGGQIEVMKLKHEDGKKDAAPAVAKAFGLTVGTILGS
jgi:methionyl-tRNA formyltransferase